MLILIERKQYRLIIVIAMENNVEKLKDANLKFGWEMKSYVYAEAMPKLS